MKLTKQCLKCNSHDIVKVPGNKNITQARILLNMWGTKYLLLNKYVCMQCGYYEEYADLNAKARKWLHEIDKKQGHDEFDEFI